MNLWLQGGERIVRDFGKVMYTLLYFKWITNKDLLYNEEKKKGEGEVPSPGVG